jgi:glycosyltransferase involved in cell wall biosynthesis
MRNSEVRLAVIVPAYNEAATIEATLAALYGQAYKHTTEHIIVDNGSTDATRSVIQRFADNHDDFPLRIIDESQKGTGAAADTGMRSAIERGATVVARTDADTLPQLNWTDRILSHFNSQTNTQLLGGRIMALRDHNYRLGDSLLMPLAVKGARVALALRHFNRGYLQAVTGGNMATKAQAYETVGGFPRTSIDELDEDIAYSLRIAQGFGRRAITINNGLVVETSMRRIRSQGWIGTALHHLVPERRQHGGQQLDVRS